MKSAECGSRNAKRSPRPGHATFLQPSDVLYGMRHCAQTCVYVSIHLRTQGYMKPHIHTAYIHKDIFTTYRIEPRSNAFQQRTREGAGGSARSHKRTKRKRSTTVLLGIDIPTRVATTGRSQFGLMDAPTPPPEINNAR